MIFRAAAKYQWPILTVAFTLAVGSTNANAGTGNGEKVNRDLTEAQHAISRQINGLDPRASIIWAASGDYFVFWGSFSPERKGEPQQIAKDFLAEMNIPPVDQRDRLSLSAIRTEVDQFGHSHVFLEQSVSNVPIWSKSIIVHLNVENQVIGVGGRYIYAIGGFPEQPRVSQRAAIGAAIDDAQMPLDTQPLETPRLVIFEHNGDAKLAWDLIIRQESASLPLASWNYLVDAQNGDVLIRFDRIVRQAALGSGLSCDLATRTLQIFEEDGDFELRDRTRKPDGGAIVTRDCGDISIDSDGVWNNTNDNPRRASQLPETSVHFWLGRAYDRLKQLTGREGYNGAGANVVADAHCYANDPLRKGNQAAWDPDDKVIKFGDGDGINYTHWGCANDMIAHEFMHAVTDRVAGLKPMKESGALNESYSDIFAVMVDGDWLIGEDMILPAAGEPAIRNFGDPTKGGLWDPGDDYQTIRNKKVPQPSRYEDRFKGIDDAYGIHINNGIYNHLFYLVADGEVKAPTGSGNTCHPGVGRIKAWEAFYIVLDKMLSPESTIPEAADNLSSITPFVLQQDPFGQLVVDHALAETGLSAKEDPLSCVDAGTWLIF